MSKFQHFICIYHIASFSLVQMNIYDEDKLLYNIYEMPLDTNMQILKAFKFIHLFVTLL